MLGVLPYKMGSRTGLGCGEVVGSLTGPTLHRDTNLLFPRFGFLVGETFVSRMSLLVT
jgi:hypothetical protein